MQEEIEDRDTYEDLDETDNPTFLPQRPPIAHYNIFEGLWNKETNRVFLETEAAQRTDPWNTLGSSTAFLHGHPG